MRKLINILHNPGDWYQNRMCLAPQRNAKNKKKQFYTSKQTHWWTWLSSSRKCCSSANPLVNPRCCNVVMLHTLNASIRGIRALSVLPISIEPSVGALSWDVLWMSETDVDWEMGIGCGSWAPNESQIYIAGLCLIPKCQTCAHSVQWPLPSVSNLSKALR